MPHQVEWQCTRLNATVVEEDGGFWVRVRLYHHLNEYGPAWGEERAASVDVATRMIDDLAKALSIARDDIKVSVVRDLRAS